MRKCRQTLDRHPEPCLFVRLPKDLGAYFTPRIFCLACEISFKNIKAHDDEPQSDEYDACRAVERFRLSLVCEKRRDLRPQKGEYDAQNPGERIGQSVDREMRKGTCERGESHDENARADGGFEFIAHNRRENEKHHHSASRADEPANEPDERAENDQLNHALFYR